MKTILKYFTKFTEFPDFTYSLKESKIILIKIIKVRICIGYNLLHLIYIICLFIMLLFCKRTGEFGESSESSENKKSEKIVVTTSQLRNLF